MGGNSSKAVKPMSGQSDIQSNIQTVQQISSEQKQDITNFENEINEETVLRNRRIPSLKPTLEIGQTEIIEVNTTHERFKYEQVPTKEDQSSKLLDTGLQMPSSIRESSNNNSWIGIQNGKFDLNTIWKDIYEVTADYIWVYSSRQKPMVWWFMKPRTSADFEEKYNQYLVNRNSRGFLSSILNDDIDYCVTLNNGEKLKLNFNKMEQYNRHYGTTRNIARLSHADLRELREQYESFLKSRNKLWMYGTNRTYVIYPPDIQLALDKGQIFDFRMNGRVYTVNPHEMYQLSDNDKKHIIYKVDGLESLQDKYVFGACFSLCRKDDQTTRQPDD